jgi:hypothetical protein
LDVHEHEVGLEAGGLVEGVFAGLEFAGHDVAGAAEVKFDEVGNLGLVFDNEYPFVRHKNFLAPARGGSADFSLRGAPRGADGRPNRLAGDLSA